MAERFPLPIQTTAAMPQPGVQTNSLGHQPTISRLVGMRPPRAGLDAGYCLPGMQGPNQHIHADSRNMKRTESTYYGYCTLRTISSR